MNGLSQQIHRNAWALWGAEGTRSVELLTLDRCSGGDLGFLGWSPGARARGSAGSPLQFSLSPPLLLLTYACWLPLFISKNKLINKSFLKKCTGTLLEPTHHLKRSPLGLGSAGSASEREGLPHGVSQGPYLASSESLSCSVTSGQ